MPIYKDGHGSYGHCWIEGNGVTFWSMSWTADPNTVLIPH